MGMRFVIQSHGRLGVCKQLDERRAQHADMDASGWALRSHSSRTCWQQ